MAYSSFSHLIADELSDYLKQMVSTGWRVVRGLSNKYKGIRFLLLEGVAIDELNRDFWLQCERDEFRKPLPAHAAVSGKLLELYDPTPWVIVLEETVRNIVQVAVLPEQCRMVDVCQSRKPTARQYKRDPVAFKQPFISVAYWFPPLVDALVKQFTHYVPCTIILPDLGHTHISMRVQVSQVKRCAQIPGEDQRLAELEDFMVVCDELPGNWLVLCQSAIGDQILLNPRGCPRVVFSVGQASVSMFAARPFLKEEIEVYIQDTH